MVEQEFISGGLATENPNLRAEVMSVKLDHNSLRYAVAYLRKM